MGRPQRLDLRVEHAAVHQEAVGEDHRRAVTTRVVVGDLDSVDGGGGHGALPLDAMVSAAG
jgi:hypothetical protein